MKRIYSTIIILTILLPWLTSCGSDDATGKSEEQLNAEKLSGSWALGTNGYITRDGSDLSGEYQDFVIRFTTNHSYTVLKDPNNVFFPTGTWKFAEGTFSQILLNNNMTPISLQFENATTITLTFAVIGDTPIGQRVKGISGSYELRLTKL